jgi:cytoskeletal protein CcmA (bactofilin family)
MSLLVRQKNGSELPDPDSAVLPVSHLGAGLTVRGILEGAGEVHIDGTVVGRVSADCIVIGVAGNVEGDMRAKEVRIGGRMNGRVFAVNVAVGSSADVRGRVFHHTVSVASGARVDGRMPWRPVNYFETLKQFPEE